jgi:hypothetical protein
MPVPRPSEAEAKPVDEAKVSLGRNADLAAVIKAAESGDADELLQLAQRTDSYCASSRELPPQCKSLRDIVPAVLQDNGHIVPRPVETMRRWLGSIFLNRPVSLEFAVRDSRQPEGNGGKYYLLFRASKPAADFEGLNGVMVLVSPGKPQPIENFAFFDPDTKGLIWVQYVTGEGAKDLILITPESVKDWPGL